MSCMQCIGPVMNPGASRDGSQNQQSLHKYSAFPPKPLTERSPSLPQHNNLSNPYPIIEVGSSRFIIKSRDSNLIQELRLFCETLEESPRAEIRFTNRLIHCTEQGRLQPWAWQRQSNSSG